MDSAFIKLVIGSFLRQGLSVLAGILLTVGIQQEQVDSFIGSSELVIYGLITYGVTQIWSLVQKKVSGTEPVAKKKTK